MTFNQAEGRTETYTRPSCLGDELWSGPRNKVWSRFPSVTLRFSSSMNRASDSREACRGGPSLERRVTSSTFSRLHRQTRLVERISGAEHSQDYSSTRINQPAANANRIGTSRAFLSIDSGINGDALTARFEREAEVGAAHSDAHGIAMCGGKGNLRFSRRGRYVDFAFSRLKTGAVSRLEFLAGWFRGMLHLILMEILLCMATSMGTITSLDGVLRRQLQCP